MKEQRMSMARKATIFTLMVVLLTPFTVSRAATFVVKFGGSVGTEYSPKTLNVSVGDTISWQGSFSFHPLSSTSVPVGAQSFHEASGTVFAYPVLVAGTYTYQCDLHVSLGMVGSFVAGIAAGVENPNMSLVPGEFSLGQNYPNPFNPSTEIKFALPENAHVLLKIYGVNGQEISTVSNADYPAGIHTVTWNASAAASGVYFYRITAGKFSATRKMLLVR